MAKDKAASKKKATKNKAPKAKAKDAVEPEDEAKAPEAEPEAPKAEAPKAEAPEAEAPEAPAAEPKEKPAASDDSVPVYARKDRDRTPPPPMGRQQGGRDLKVEEKIIGTAPDGEPLIKGLRGVKSGKIWDTGAINDYYRRKRARQE